MIVEQIYTSCLSQGSYYIESNNEVAIIDPIREIDSYLEKANKRGSKTDQRTGAPRTVEGIQLLHLGIRHALLLPSRQP